MSSGVSSLSSESKRKSNIFVWLAVSRTFLGMVESARTVSLVSKIVLVCHSVSELPSILSWLYTKETIDVSYTPFGTELSCSKPDLIDIALDEMPLQLRAQGPIRMRAIGGFPIFICPGQQTE